jgi:hypothetical protein
MFFPIIEEENKAEAKLDTDIDNEQYCICRRWDDKQHFMIECDTCKEWFHGPCIGMTEEESSLYQSYICIGCARISHKFDPLDPEPVYE